MTSKLLSTVSWDPPLRGWLKFKTDGVLNGNGNACCGDITQVMIIGWWGCSGALLIATILMSLSYGPSRWP